MYCLYDIVTLVVYDIVTLDVYRSLLLTRCENSNFKVGLFNFNLGNFSFKVCFFIFGVGILKKIIHNVALRNTLP